ncbi:stAR-related lipid transfer protein 3-like isoform X1 [Lineus longissimus]|uniref:stAR-related lipid transfer protein 3-like isoform X1 n=2 Tax=Lineus longissimus TaxID=88925 RepID=UPI00315DCDF4
MSSEWRPLKPFDGNSCAKENSEDVMVTDRNVKAQEVGQLLYGSLHGSSGTYGTISTADPKKFSAVRRTFCLMALFDLILAFILWVIYTQLSGFSPISVAIKDQVGNYHFDTSLFDTVLLGAFRFIVLELSYALYRSKRPWMVALTTFLTCVFLVTKVFLFNFTNPKATDHTMEYIVLVVSFVMAWVETWFLDFRVLPQELKIRERAALLSTSYHPPSGTNERTPLTRDIHGQYDHPYHGPDTYYSPISSMPPSDDENSEDEGIRAGFRSLPHSRGHSRQASGTSVNTLGFQEQVYLQKAREALETVWDLYKHCDEWVFLAGNDEDGNVYGKSDKKIGKIFKLTGYIDCDPLSMYEEMCYRLDESPKWNPTVLECRSLRTIDSHTEIHYSVAAESAGGLVSARDFVNVRQWLVREGIYLVTGVACEYAEMPQQKNYVRGENRPGVLAFEPIPDNPDGCNFVWILNTDLKGWIPQYLIDQAMSGVVMKYLRHLRLRALEIKQEKASQLPV